MKTMFLKERRLEARAAQPSKSLLKASHKASIIILEVVLQTDTLQKTCGNQISKQSLFNSRTEE
jgi:hypothetical protein